MRRREFIQNTLGGIAVLATAKMSGLAFAQDVSTPSLAKTSNSSSKIRGVNLGAWLVLERWMTPDTYRGTDAQDEYSLCLTLGDKAKSRLDQHRDNFITSSDFRWIGKCGLNTVRLPVGYWALEA